MGYFGLTRLLDTNAETRTQSLRFLCNFGVYYSSGFRGTPSQRFDSGAPALIVRQIHNFTQRGHMMLDAKGISDPTPAKGLALMTSLFMDENQISMLL